MCVPNGESRCSVFKVRRPGTDDRKIEAAIPVEAHIVRVRRRNHVDAGDGIFGASRKKGVNELRTDALMIVNLKDLDATVNISPRWSTVATC